MCNYSDVIRQDDEVGQDHDVVGDSQRAPATVKRRAGTPDDFNYSSDIVQDTKNRLWKLESEAENLEKNYRDFQFRVTHLDPVIEPEMYRQDISRSTTAQIQRDQISSLGHVSHVAVLSRPQPEPEMYQQDKSRVVAQMQKEPASSLGQVSHVGVRQSENVRKSLAAKQGTMQHDHIICPPLQPQRVADSSSVPRVDQSLYTETRQPHTVVHTIPSEANRVVPVDDEISQAAAIHDTVSRTCNKDEQAFSYSSSVHAGYREWDGESDRLQQAVGRLDTGSHHVGDSASEAVLTSSVSQPSPPSPVQPPAAADFGTVSLDDAWKTLTTGSQPSNEAERLEHKRTEQEQFERLQKQREEERHCLDEEARQREQQALHELQRQQQQSIVPKSFSSEEQPVSGAVMTEVENGAAGDAEPAALEPKIDPELEKYMAIVRQQREKEKQAEKEARSLEPAEKDVSPAQSADDFSVDDEPSESIQTDDKDDFW